MVKIAPSILSADFSRLGDEIRDAIGAGADLIHIDVMDGHFVPNITVGPLIVKAVKRVSSIPLDVHLMIEEPDRYIKAFADSGADMITVHSEACIHLHRSIQNIREFGIKAGVSINPATPLSDIEFILPFVDIVLLMSVNPGFGGQEFIPEVIPKIRRLRRMIDDNGYKVGIEVDGGINPDNAAGVVSAGADILVMGNAFYGSDDYLSVIETVRERCKGIGSRV
ncbi:MAG: ribulose-phosphate 3-epimerase [Thermodesulfovibrionia bacterium]